MISKSHMAWLCTRHALSLVASVAHAQALKALRTPRSKTNSSLSNRSKPHQTAGLSLTTNDSRQTRRHCRFHDDQGRQPTVRVQMPACRGCFEPGARHYPHVPRGCRVPRARVRPEGGQAHHGRRQACHGGGQDRVGYPRMISIERLANLCQPLDLSISGQTFGHGVSETPQGDMPKNRVPHSINGGTHHVVTQHHFCRKAQSPHRSSSLPLWLLDVRTEDDFIADPALIPGSSRRPWQAVDQWANEVAGDAVVICIEVKNSVTALRRGSSSWVLRERA